MVQHDVKCNCIKDAGITAISRIRVCVCWGGGRILEGIRMEKGELRRDRWDKAGWMN